MSYWEPGRPKAQENVLRSLKVPRMRALLERIGSPQLQYPSVLVAGTKGKGSTVAFIAEGLRAAGYRVGRYTQPHLIDWRERSWVDGSLIEPEEVAALAERIRPAVEDLHQAMGELGGLTTYEVGTALTLAHFADRQVDAAVLEMGIGGRLDALNAVDPLVSAVTAISFDHTDVLGDTLSKIAEEKAGVLRQGRVALSAPQPSEAEEALRREAMEVGAHLSFVGQEWRWADGSEQDTIDICGPMSDLKRVRVPLLGDHQRENATLAAAVLQSLAQEGFHQIDDEAIRRGISSVEWPGRIQVLRRDPLVVVDAAHNEDSTQHLMDTIRKQFQYERLILVFGASANKHIEEMAMVLGPTAHSVIVTASGHRRAADAEKLALEFSRYGEVCLEPDVTLAFDRALRVASPSDLVLITGSVFLAGKAIEALSTE